MKLSLGLGLSFLVLAAGLTFLDVIVGLSLVTTAFVAIIGLGWRMAMRLYDKLQEIEKSIEELKGSQRNVNTRLDDLERE